MQAIILTAHGSADNFRLVNLPVPPLRHGDVRIKVKSISFNPIDYQTRQSLPEGSVVKSPILGRDLSGVVDAVADDVADFCAGDEVYSYVCNLASSGTYAEYVSVPAVLVAKKPRSLTHDQAASVPVACVTAHLALKKVHAGSDKSLFIAGGAGGVGTFAIMLARQLKVRQLLTSAGNDASRAYLIEKCGLKNEHIINYKDDHFIANVIAKNDGFFDGVLDLVGGKMLSAGCQLLAVDGHLASVVDAPSQEDFEFLFQRNASFHAVGANAYSLVNSGSNLKMSWKMSWKKYQHMLIEFAAMFDRGELTPPTVTNMGMLSVDTVKAAHDLLERSAVPGKLVMSCN